MTDLRTFNPVLKDVYRKGKTMPISKYFKGHGEEVMAGMRKKYGARAEEVFYRTANKKGMKPGGKKKSHLKAGMEAGAK